MSTHAPAHEAHRLGRSAVDERSVDEVVKAGRALSDPVRVRLVMELAAGGELRVGDLATRLGLPQPTVSHHLGLLLVSGLVRRRRDGRMAYYAVAEQPAAGRDARPTLRLNVAGLRLSVGPVAARP